MLFHRRHIGHNVVQSVPFTQLKIQFQMNETNASIQSVFKSFNQIIWIVTASFEEKRGGLTATWVHQASIDSDKPVVNIGLAPNHFTCELATQSMRLGLHILRPNQADIAYHFSKPSGRDFDKLAGINLLDSDIPILSDCHTSFQCEIFSRNDAGDRIYFLADVTDIKQNSNGPMMRESDFFSQCSEAEIQTLRSDLSKDVDLQRPMLAEFKRTEAIKHKN